MLETHIASLSHSTERITIHEHPTMNGLEEELVAKWSVVHHIHARPPLAYMVPHVHRLCPPPPPTTYLSPSPPHAHTTFNQTSTRTNEYTWAIRCAPRRSAGWDHDRHHYEVQDKEPDYAHADPCRQEKRSVYIFDLFVSRPSAPDLTTKVAQLDFNAQAAPEHLTEVSVGVFFEQASSPPISQHPSRHPGISPNTSDPPHPPHPTPSTPMPTCLPPMRTCQPPVPVRAGACGG